MIRGTTPTVSIRVGADLTGCDDIHVAFRNNKNVIVKAYPDEVRISGYQDGFTIVSTRLTQEDTLSFKAGKPVEVQIRFSMNGSAGAVEYFDLVESVYDILEEGEI